MNNYTQAIKKIRGLKGLTQKQLAKKLKVDPSLVSMVESGSRKPTEDFVNKFSNELGVSRDLMVLLSTPKLTFDGFTSKETEQLIRSLLKLLDE